MKPLYALPLLALAGCNKPAPAPEPVVLDAWMSEEGSCTFSIEGRRLTGEDLKRRIAEAKGGTMSVRAGSAYTPRVCLGSAIAMIQAAGVKPKLAAPPSSLTPTADR